MILYVNGDSHAAAAEAVNPYAFAEDDGAYRHLGRAPHPDNLAVSWGRLLSQSTKSSLHCDAESASSNARILRTARHWIQTHKPWAPEILLIIQWSTWERQEWYIDGRTYQVTASGIDDVPPSHQDQYRIWVANVDWTAATHQSHDEIWKFHTELKDLGIKHVFFNGNNHFAMLPKSARRSWGSHYIGPYEPTMTFDQWLRCHKFSTVSPKSWHFGADAHAAWHRFMLYYIIEHQLMEQ